MIAFIAIFFYGVIIVMEVRKNQFLLYKMQYPEQKDIPKDYSEKTAPEIATIMNNEADEKVTALIIAIGLNIACIIGCLVQVKIGEKQERERARLEEQGADKDL
jgi:hypothetical protein